MLPNGVSRASPVLIAVMQLFAHVYLLIKTRREAANNRSRRFISMMSMWNGTLLIMVMRLFYLVIKWIQVRKQTKTKPHDLISLLAQYRYNFFPKNTNILVAEYRWNSPLVIMIP